jgi:hypothetical protein
MSVRSALLVLMVSLLAGVPLVSGRAADLPTYDSVVANPRTVVDYFLLCPQLSLDEAGHLILFPESVDGRQSFDDKKSLLRKGYSARDFSVDAVTIDIPNAFIEIGGEENGLRFTLTFVYFDRQGAPNVPAFSYYSEGGDGDTYEIGFFDTDGSDPWTDITDKVLPSLSLADLDANQHSALAHYPSVDWQYILPQKGTTVIAVPHMTYTMAETASPRADYDTAKRLINHSLELPWNKKDGRFLKGKIR